MEEGKQSKTQISLSPRAIDTERSPRGNGENSPQATSQNRIPRRSDTTQQYESVMAQYNQLQIEPPFGLWDNTSKRCGCKWTRQAPPKNRVNELKKLLSFAAQEFTLRDAFHSRLFETCLELLGLSDARFGMATNHPILTPRDQTLSEALRQTNMSLTMFFLTVFPLFFERRTREILVTCEENSLPLLTICNRITEDIVAWGKNKQLCRVLMENRSAFDTSRCIFSAYLLNWFKEYRTHQDEPEAIFRRLKGSRCMKLKTLVDQGISSSDN